jgi:hypothetical protein
MVTVIFIDGSMITAGRFRDVEAELRSDMWNRPYDKGGFRQELVRRAYNWSNWTVEYPRSSRELFEQLEDAGLLRIADYQEEAS